MSAHIVSIVLLGLVPILLFVGVLLYLDSFKLVSIPMLTAVLALGGGVVVSAAYFLSGPVMDNLHLSFPSYSRYVAPVLEESLKASVILFLIARNRIGFMIDAAILGIGVGAGFAFAENIYYATVFPDANMGVWMVRGLGTAFMHGGATAIFGVTTQNLTERHKIFNPINYIPGLVLAVSLHSIYNQFIGWPIASTALMVVLLPLAMYFVFDKSEHEAHDWLLHDYESHEHLLEAIRDGSFAHGEAGRFIESLTSRFGKDHVADIFAYLSLHTVLVLEAEKRLLAREKGLEEEPAKVCRQKFVELHALEKRIGKTAMLVIWPHLKFSHKELWELHELEAAANR